MAIFNTWHLSSASSDSYISAFKSNGKDETTIQRWSSLIGIVTAIVGNILISFALNVQRYAHIRLSRDSHGLAEDDERESSSGKGQDRSYGTYGQREDQINDGNGAGRTGFRDDVETDSSEDDQSRHDQSDSATKSTEKSSQPSSRKTYLQSPYWWAGLLLMTIGEAGNFLAYGFAPASIVSPLGVVALISNCIIAPFMLKERFRQRDFWGVMIAITGAVIVALSAKPSESKLGPHEIWTAISRIEFLVYFGVTIVLISALLWTSQKHGQRTVLVDLGLVALFGGYTVLATKGIASLLSFTFWRILTFPLTYLLLAVLISTAMLQIRYLNKALQRFNSTQVIPIQFVLFTISVIIGSSVLYGDFKSAGTDRIAKFVVGCLLTFGGVYCITSGRKPEEESDERFARLQEDEEAEVGFLDEQDEEEVDESEQDSMTKAYRDQGADYFLSTHQRPEPQTPRRASSTTFEPPRIIVTPQTESASEGAETPEASPLLENPWKTPDEGKQSFPIRNAAYKIQSSPIVPTQSRQSGQSSSTAHGMGHSQYPPKTPELLSQRRTSVSRMLPGPLFSPLSSSLSGVVAESLRRGFDITPTKASESGDPRTPSRLSVARSFRRSKSHRSSRMTGSSSSQPLIDSPLTTHDDQGTTSENFPTKPEKRRGLGSLFDNVLHKVRGSKTSTADDEDDH